MTQPTIPEAQHDPNRSSNGVTKLPKAKNVLGGKLAACCTSPMTGFFRDGCCNTGPEDVGSHTVCVVMTAEFLEYSKSVGNDLSTPNLQWGFPGLQPGDRWCLSRLAGKKHWMPG